MRPFQPENPLEPVESETLVDEIILGNLLIKCVEPVPFRIGKRRQRAHDGRPFHDGEARPGSAAWPRQVSPSPGSWRTLTKSQTATERFSRARTRLCVADSATSNGMGATLNRHEPGRYAVRTHLRGPRTRCLPRAEMVPTPPDMPPDTLPEISVVVPVRNEGPNIGPLVAEIRQALAGIPHEIVYVDDGSADDTPDALRVAGVVWRRHRVSCRAECGDRHRGAGGARRADRNARRRRAERSGGHSRPYSYAFARSPARGPVLVTGHRTQRRDSWMKRHSSRVANRVRARLLRDATPDTGCGLKLFERAAFLELPHFDHMHR